MGYALCAIGDCMLQSVMHSVGGVLVLNAFCAMPGVWCVYIVVCYVWAIAHSVTLGRSVLFAG